MTAHALTCQSCDRKVHGELYHLGFSDMEALYCSACPSVLLLKDPQLLEVRGVSLVDIGKFEFYNRHLLPYFARVEALFAPCACGGRYAYMNPPRCPWCKGLMRGDCYEDKPILKQRDGYVFVCGGSVEDAHHLRSAAA